MAGGVGGAIQNIHLPGKKEMIGGYREAKNSVTRININSINVRFFPSNSPFFIPTKGELYHFTTVTLMKVEVPEKLGFIVQDDSIFFDKITKEEWVDCRQDYPLTFACGKQLADILTEAMKALPDVTEWYIPASINKIPVQNIIVENNLQLIPEQKDTLGKAGVDRSILEWMDKIPAKVTITPKFLYDFMDIQVVGSLKNEENKFQWGTFIMGGLFFSLISVFFMLYIGR
jgi:hypothetical protein